MNLKHAFSELFTLVTEIWVLSIKLFFPLLIFFCLVTLLIKIHEKGIRRIVAIAKEIPKIIFDSGTTSLLISFFLSFFIVMGIDLIDDVKHRLFPKERNYHYIPDTEVPSGTNTINNNPGMRYIESYQRSDGTQVKGHWRTNPDGIEENNLNFNGK